MQCLISIGDFDAITDILEKEEQISNVVQASCNAIEDSLFATPVSAVTTKEREDTAAFVPGCTEVEGLLCTLSHVEVSASANACHISHANDHHRCSLGIPDTTVMDDHIIGNLSRRFSSVSS